jgi:small subunit ribosomal protein S4
VSDWGTQLREKQKARHTYGVLEAQFRKYFQRAQHSPGTTGEILLQLLERRLDNVVFRLDFAESRAQARQLVRHGHIKVGGRKVSIPSFQVKEDDTVEWRETTQSRDFFKSLSAASPRKSVPGWLALDPAKMAGRVLHMPLTDEMDIIVDTRMIVEFYSK